MRARFERDGHPPVEDEIHDHFVGFMAIERQGSNADGYWHLAGLDDDGTRVYAWKADSMLDWLTTQPGGNPVTPGSPKGTP